MTNNVCPVCKRVMKADEILVKTYKVGKELPIKDVFAHLNCPQSNIVLTMNK